MPKRTYNRAATALYIFFGLYCLFFVYRSSFVIGGVRYFSLFDDAMISMVYAKNFVAGHGLVWNAGGPVVEGYTNPLWVLYMSLLHLLPVPAPKISLLVQLSGAVFLFFTLVYVRKIARKIGNSSEIPAIGAVFLTALYYPHLYWSLMGMEVSILMLIMSATVWRALSAMEKKEAPTGLFVLLGAATLVRIDMAVPCLAVTLALLVTVRRKRKPLLVKGVLILAAFLGAQTLFRLWYYGAPLPNTYYLKMTGVPLMLRLARGLYVFSRFAWGMNIVLFLFPVAAVLARREKQRLVLLWLVVVQLLYSIYVGGDAWEEWGGSNRFIAIAMPLYMVLFAVTVYDVVRWIRDKRRLEMQRRPLSRALVGVYGLVLAGSLLFFNSYALREFLFIDKPYNVDYNREMVERALIIGRISTPDASVAVTWAGAIPYFTDRTVYDVLGKNDPRIARQDVKYGNDFDIARFKPGHMKWDHDYTLGELKPDIIPLLWGGGRERAWPYIREHYTGVTISTADGDSYYFWLRKDSENIRWE